MGTMKEHPKNQVVSVRVTDEEKEKVEMMAMKSGVSVDNLIRGALIEMGILKYQRG